MELQEKIKVLKKSCIFSLLTKPELEPVAGQAFAREFLPGEFLIREEEPCEFFYLLVEGKFRAFLDSSLGKDLTLITFFRPGETLGPTSVFRDRPSSGSIQALTRSRVLGFPKNAVIGFIGKHPPVALQIIRVLAARVSELNRRLRDVTGERVEQRLFRVMLTLYRRYGPTLMITRQELAEMVGATTETIIRILSSLRKDKIIASDRGKITVLDAPRLRWLSEGL